MPVLFLKLYQSVDNLESHYYIYNDELYFGYDYWAY